MKLMTPAHLSIDTYAVRCADCGRASRVPVGRDYRTMYCRYCEQYALTLAAKQKTSPAKATAFVGGTFAVFLVVALEINEHVASRDGAATFILLTFFLWLGILFGAAWVLDDGELKDWQVGLLCCGSSLLGFAIPMAAVGLPFGVGILLVAACRRLRLRG